MRKSIIYMIALTAINLGAVPPTTAPRSKRTARPPQDYIFANATGHISKGYVIRIDDDQGNELRTLGRGQADYVPFSPRYEITGFKKGMQKAGTYVFTPEEFNPQLGIERPVVIINFYRLFNKGIAPEQYTLPEAREKYGHRIQFPEEQPQQRRHGKKARGHYRAQREQQPQGYGESRGY